MNLRTRHIDRRFRAYEERGTIAFFFFFFDDDIDLRLKELHEERLIIGESSKQEIHDAVVQASKSDA